MTSRSKEEKAKSMFESRFMSIILMFCLVIMFALFIVVIWTLFDKESVIKVIMYLGIGIGSGLIVTMTVLLIMNKRKAKLGRNLLLYLVAGILIISLILSLIMNFAVGSWAFISTSSVGLGLTTGIALTYLFLAMFRSNLVSGKEEVEDTEENLVEVELKSEEEINK